MDRAAARQRLQRMVAHAEDPALDSDEIETLLDDCRRPDINGLAPHDGGWQGTYDLNAAAAAGYRQKAGKIAGRDAFSADGASFDRGKGASRLLDMAKAFEETSLGNNLSGGDDTGTEQILGPQAHQYADPPPFILNI